MASRHSRYGDIIKAFGNAVRLFRTKSGCSQEMLADRAKLDRSYMSQIERGIKNATLNSIWTISSALEVRPSDLMLATEKFIGLSPTTPDATSPSEVLVQTDHIGSETQIHTLQSSGQTENMILVVDDDPDICAAIGCVLKDAGFRVSAASNGMEAIRYLSAHQVKAVVSDVRMSHGNGFELLDIMKTHFPKLPLFFITGYDDVTEEDALNKGAHGLFNKPFDLADFVNRVKSSMDPLFDPKTGTLMEPIH